MTESFSGTSAAAPFVSAASAIIYTMLYEPQNKEKHPDAEQIVSCLYENAVDIGEPVKINFSDTAELIFGIFM